MPWKNYNKRQQYNRAYYWAHREALIQRTREYRAKHRKELNQKSIEYWHSHREEGLAKQRIRMKAHRSELRETILRALGGVCRHCGFTDNRALHIDHVNGGGGQQRRAMGRGWVYLKYVLEHLDQFQLLCANCNCIKQAERPSEAGRKFAIVQISPGTPN